MGYVLGFDLGTSYFKASLVDCEGNCVGTGRIATPKHHKGTVVSISPKQFQETVLTCITQVLAQASAEAQDIKGISYGSQATSFILFDKQMKPITDIVLWPSFYSNEVDPEYREFAGNNDFLQTTGLGIFGPGLFLAKLIWLKKNKPELWQTADQIMTISDYFLYILTGSIVSDTSTSSLLGIIDQKKQALWELVLPLIDKPAGFFPEFIFPGTLAGETNKGSLDVGLVPKIPVYAGTLDHVAAAVGAGIHYLAETSESTGTVLACIGIRNEYKPEEGMCVGGFLEPGKYVYLAFEDDGAEVIEWYHNTYIKDLSIDDMLDLAEEVPAGAYGLLYKPGRLDRDLTECFVCDPDSDSDCDYEPAVYIRAICESLAKRTGSLAERVSGVPVMVSGIPAMAAGVQNITGLLATGGANINRTLRKIKADIIGTKVITIRQKELGTFGAAMIAAAGIGWYNSIQEVQKSWITVDEVIPDSIAARGISL
ncbi:MAG: hypothetical protein KAQ69_03045 [Spirochaetales bacterium]|nr:hypothetical protein [Spirochaetales bacterium]